MALCGSNFFNSTPPLVATDTETVHAPIIKDVKNLDRLIKSKKYPVNTLDHLGNSPLHIAAFLGHSRQVQVLIDNKVIRTQQNIGGRTALHLAIENLSEADALTITQHLITRINLPKEQPLTPMYIGIKQGFKTTQEADAFCVVNIPDHEGLTPLHMAIRSEKRRVVIALLQYNAIILCPDKFGIIPLHLALKSGNLPLAEALLTEHLARFKVYMTQNPTVFFVL